jgi:hypothetical protein
MKRLIKNKRGQFVIIAVLLVAIMIISVGGLLHTAVTYYKHEPWEEYSTLISDIELNSRRLVELSLVNYTQTANPDVLNRSLTQWRLDLMRLYPSSGIALDFSLPSGSGLALDWNQAISSSSARADFTVNITSIGLYGYKFTAVSFLKMEILTFNSVANTTDVVVVDENGVLASSLKRENFRVNGLPVSNMTSSYDALRSTMKYTLYYEGASPPVVEVWDLRGIRITGCKLTP